MRRNFSWTIVGNIVYAASQWGILIVLARLGSAEHVGQFALALAVVTPVMVFTNLQLRSVQATDARREFEFRDYFQLRMITIVIALVTITTAATVGGYDRELFLTVMAFAAAKAFEAVSDVVYGVLQQRERMDRIAASMMFRGPMALAIMASLFYLSGSVALAITGMAAAKLITFFTYDMNSAEAFLPGARKELRRLDVDWRKLGRLALVSLPVGLVMGVISLEANLPRYFIETHLSVAQLGVFAALSYMTFMGQMVVQAINQSAIARLAIWFAEGKLRQFRQLVLRLLAIDSAVGLTGLALAVVAGRLILTIAYGAEYAAHMNVFLWLIAAAAVRFSALPIELGLRAMRYFWLQFWIHAVSVVVMAVGCVTLVPRYGLLGAAYSTMAMGIWIWLSAAISMAVLLQMAARSNVSEEILVDTDAATTPVFELTRVE